MLRKADKGLLAGYGFAVHYPKAMINRRIKGDTDVRDHVDDVASQEEGDTPESTVSGLRRGVRKARSRFASVGQVPSMMPRNRHLFLMWQ